ncbi:tRNA preQ1(34) S-adenosylmethionine ribosyltransferase-isomerase QueA [Desulfovibrio sulfodismutans]|uniref:S-adenosylmethionine:tRNA ribosyltransferase-isomerase n=1 Tax=Desulfolutivibrio sulfodismutans TaxID=63561 RepID=A0A7K3NM50_9BACT|nr:tRNA preQ1(34) S-adenosylmethionine ribosyltransferase-isomerase QueA [Desulfolutivibrio sulfodismutans]NDY57197.1 tRNA preQ1(34) S-adenosylmethionine ribosyltransferase-isomerase QueA [Desulfolutivibrio sulfodismutans]QLA11811.1 tRNA preQ1(34) S-adenosylmethionine ribosyltransferase-isomerase QueA [Desulfolutivibrio sulfodismutans DSM 3696]
MTPGPHDPPHDPASGDPGGVPADCDLGTYQFHLPPELIAQRPLPQRDASRLMLLSRETGGARQARFADLPDLLPPNALLVANNTRVAPVRLFGRKKTGGAVEFLLLTPPVLLSAAPDPGRPGRVSARAVGLLRASKAPKPGDLVTFSDELSLTVISRGEFGHAEVMLSYVGRLPDILDAIGHMPLPPYIKRPDETADASRYQTVYARPDKPGSAAAPTAGLHFTPDMRHALKKRGFDWAEVTLHVGYGTFSPVRATDIRNHDMHREHLEIPPETAAAVSLAKSQGRPVIAVGTTSVRALEGAFAATGRIAPFVGATDIFLRPGCDFQVIDGLFTNFHLPGSTLLIMICALAGTDHVLSAYHEAISAGFRFFSYGDAMLIV